MNKFLPKRMFRIAGNMTLVLLALFAYGLIVYAWGYIEQFGYK